MELLKEIQHYITLQESIKALEREKELLRKRLIEIVRACGGKLAVGDFILSLSEVSRPRFGDLLTALTERHPDLASEIDELKSQFTTTYERLDIAKSN